MIDATKRKILECASYIIDKNASIPETSAALGYSIRSIQKYINDQDKLRSISSEIYLTVRTILNQKEIEGRSRGGKISKRRPTIDEATALKIAKYMISNNMTYEVAEEKFGIPSSTIYETVRRINDASIQISLDKIAFENRGGKKHK